MEGGCGWEFAGHGVNARAKLVWVGCWHLHEIGLLTHPPAPSLEGGGVREFALTGPKNAQREAIPPERLALVMLKKYLDVGSGCFGAWVCLIVCGAHALGGEVGVDLCGGE